MEIVLQLQALITLAVIIFAIVSFVRGMLSPEITGLCSVGLLVATGVLEPNQALAGFGSPALVTLIGLFAVSAGVFRSGCLDYLRELIGSDFMSSPRRMVLLFTTIMAPISGFIPNTPIVATLLPVIEGWCHRRKISPSKVLLPFSFATVLGGTLTLLGSSVNLLASDVSQQLGYGGLDLFGFTAIGLPVWLLGSLYLLFSPNNWLVDRGFDPGSLTGDASVTDYFSEAIIPFKSKLIGKPIYRNWLQRRFSMNILKLHNHNKKDLSSVEKQELSHGDNILFKISKDDFVRLYQSDTVNIAGSRWSDEKISSWSKEQISSFGIEYNKRKVVEVLLPSGSMLAGASLQELRFRERYQANILALRSSNKQVPYDQLGTSILREGDFLLMHAPLESIRNLQASNHLFILDQLDEDWSNLNYKPAALFIVFAMILLPSLKIIPLVASVLLSAVAMVQIGCLKPSELQRSIRLDVILLLGSLSSFSSAIQQTGLSKALAQIMLHEISDWPIYLCLALVFLGTTALTEVMSNGATVALLIPVAAQLAVGLEVVPMAFIYAVIFGASQCFLSPVGYQTNLMVFGPGRYRFMDITRYGAPLTLMMTIEVPWLICHYFGL
uniref:Putative sodium/sulfate transporter, DASS family protein n=1 Tax=Paulinella chromatophora TaxID=39717 RepID=B1X564_PAUCH|nr:putative sodium/sulfate transporter, DASS family protein [Paulinella chromatophora]ACB43083.1 putative sodium/sulfate transporter, DASS family protein [Paulinella chromatophora]